MDLGFDGGGGLDLVLAEEHGLDLDFDGEYVVVRGKSKPEWRR